MVQPAQHSGPILASAPSVGLNQGQQPILNDALNYLDQVKIQFADRPDVYDQFLDIMKEFKSGSIDTPGVINRVSSLFVDHPDLIQGFNTFLPQGYSIECGSQDNPNSILVTTPGGVSLMTIAPSRRLSSSRQPGPLSAGSARSTQPLVPGFSAFLQTESLVDTPNAKVEESTPNYYGPRMPFSPSDLTPNPPDALGFMLPLQTSQALTGDDDRRPVEFNHAISYVNKIKNRFASQPDVYKQFLEILQTYQRESKPIQDVYAQVTRLFDGAPDLLDDFKQFLPESAATARNVRPSLDEPLPLSDLRGDSVYRVDISVPAVLTQPTSSDMSRLPPVGTFAPTPIAKDGKRKRGEKSHNPTVGGLFDTVTHPTVGPSNASIPGFSRSIPDDPSAPISPTLIPALPEPLAPSRTLMPLPDELAFFDRAKKFIGNRISFNEFLKLLHLFNKDLIDKSVLVYRAHSYIGGNPDLYEWFKRFVQYEDSDIIDIGSKPSFGRVALANCRGLGPSYRLLPKRQTHASCKGRDTLCRSVLNDKWISHPTWASEDSGFVAHRKNIYEEGLHRIEEERHDYDFNIEAISRTIQLLQPLAQSLRVMSPPDRKAFTLDPGLGGQSQTIYQRVIKRLYGRDRGSEVIADLFRRPYAVIPPLLTRLQAKCEDWKAAQREWEKVWREQTQKIFWKSLDHQHAQQKNADKRQFQAKSLYTEIQVKYEEQKRRREINKIAQSSQQLHFIFPDHSVILDATYLLLVHSDAGSSSDYIRLEYFLKDFITLFFGIDPQELDARLSCHRRNRTDTCSADEAADGAAGYDTPFVPPDGTITSVQHPFPEPHPMLNGPSIRHPSTPPSSIAGDISPQQSAKVVSLSDSAMDDGSRLWINLPTEAPHLSIAEQQAMQPHIRSTYNMYCNLPIYCFFRTFVNFYDRLLHLKNDEPAVRDAVRRGQAPKAARDLRMLDKVPEDFWSDTSSSAKYYNQVLVMFEDHIHGELAMADIEETLRRFYLQHGWQLYSFDKLLQSLVRFAFSIISEDGKDRTHAIYQLFRKDRTREKNTFRDELAYRHLVEKYTKDGDVFRISYSPSTHKACVSILKPDDCTLDVNKLESERRWNYYVSSYQTLDPTERLNYDLLCIPFLRRNIPVDDEITDQFMDSIMSGRSDDRLEVRICLENYRPNFSPNREEWWISNSHIRLVTRQEALHPSTIPFRQSDELAYEKHVASPSWMVGMGSDVLSSLTQRFEAMVAR